MSVLGLFSLDLRKQCFSVSCLDKILEGSQIGIFEAVAFISGQAAYVSSDDAPKVSTGQHYEMVILSYLHCNHSGVFS